MGIGAASSTVEQRRRTPETARMSEVKEVEEEEDAIGEEGEGEEEDDVAELEDEEHGPIMAGLSWIGGRVGVELSQDRVCEEGMCENGEGKREN